MNNEPMQAAPDNVGASPIEIEAWQAIIAKLGPLSQDARHRVLESAATFLGITVSVLNAAGSTPVTASSSSVPARALFSEDTSMSPKEFLNEKAPKTDVERIACLAYYLTHYRSTPHFKTLDLSILNTEAAQPKFSNATYSSNNAVKLGYLVPSSKGQRQISALGERFVQALPDRNAAKEVLLSMRRRSRSRRKRSSSKEASKG